LVRVARQIEGGRRIKCKPTQAKKSRKREGGGCKPKFRKKERKRPSGGEDDGNNDPFGGRPQARWAHQRAGPRARERKVTGKRRTVEKRKG